MQYQEKLLKLLFKPHISEKTSNLMKLNNTISFKVKKNATKQEIRDAIKKIFKIEVQNINTVQIKGKIKKNKNIIGRKKNWKKAYITLKKGQSLDIINTTE
ncbi:MAG: 50S ribosomal protein L23 [Arsenophonus sp.]|nr:MAG: 50S ribosomal protein L23 [Arsenophonus sp.]